MNKVMIFYLVLACGVVYGCAKKEPVAIRIGSITVSPGEFNTAFRDSRYPADADGRKQFLNDFIRKKLILLEAEKLGLDKDPQFLQDIQYYWEQGLLKLVLANKSKELFAGCQVTDQEINDYYQSRRDTDFLDQELPKVYDQIKWFLSQEKQNGALTRWVDGLEKRAPLQVNHQMLGIAH